MPFAIWVFSSMRGICLASTIAGRVCVCAWACRVFLFSFHFAYNFKYFHIVYDFVFRIRTYNLLAFVVYDHRHGIYKRTLRIKLLFQQCVIEPCSEKARKMLRGRFVSGACFRGERWSVDIATITNLLIWKKSRAFHIMPLQRHIFVCVLGKITNDKIPTDTDKQSAIMQCPLNRQTCRIYSNESNIYTWSSSQCMQSADLETAAPLHICLCSFSQDYSGAAALRIRVASALFTDDEFTDANAEICFINFVRWQDRQRKLRIGCRWLDVRGQHLFSWRWKVPQSL